MAPIRWCFLLFVFSLPYENISYGSYENEFTYVKFMGMILAAMAIMQPWVCFAWPPKAFWFFLAYLAVYTVRGLLQRDIGSYYDHHDPNRSSMPHLLLDRVQYHLP